MDTGFIACSMRGNWCRRHWRSGTIGARLASTYLVKTLVAKLLTPIAVTYFESAQSIAQTSWSSLGNLAPPGDSIRPNQRAWDDAVCSLRVQYFLKSLFGSDRARILASGAAASGSWIHALPSSNMGLLLSDQEIRISGGFHLGVPLVSPHTCICGTPVLSPPGHGHHGLSCKKSTGQQYRHHAVNDIIARIFRSVGVPAVFEPPGLLRADGK